MTDITYNRTARRPVTTEGAPLLQWATGLPTTDNRLYVGWFVETGKDDDLDRAMHDAGVRRVTIRHGSGTKVTHWELPEVEVLVLADGVQSVGEMRETADRLGIAYWWGATADGRPQSRILVPVLVRCLVDAGYAEPLLITAKSTQTGDVLNAVLRQYDVLDAIDALRTQQGKAALHPPLYAAWLPLGAGAEVSRGQGTQTRTITPPAALVPQDIGRDWLVARWVTDQALISRIERQMDERVAWSTQRSRLGDDPQHLASQDAAPNGATYAPDVVSETPAPVNAAPATTEEAEARFWARYGPIVGGKRLTDVYRFIGRTVPTPRDATDWLNLARIVRDTAASSSVAA